MAKTRFTSKTYLKLLIAAGILAVIGGGAGTFATFNAEVTNQNNVFANGTLFLHATPNGGATCTSESNGANSAGCTWLFNTTLTGGTQTATLQLNNAGTIDASDIKFSIGGCSVTDNFAVTGTHTTFGSAPTCTNLQLAIQETQSDFTTHTYCAYGTVSGSDCTIDTGHNLTAAAGPGLTTLLTTSGATATLVHGASRYYVIEINPNVASDNTLQNRRAQFDVTWHIDQ